MCFSASASFTVSTLLLSSGVYCVTDLGLKDSKYLPITMIPLLFGIQQFLEGMVWLEMNNTNSNLITVYGLGYLFFSHCLWLFWMAITAFAIETRHFLKRVLGGFIILGMTHGSLLYFPILFDTQRLAINIVDGSIQYQLQLLGERLLPWYLGIFIYAFIALFPLVISENKILQNLGWLIFIALIGNKFIFPDTIVSVWCFFAGVISIYLFYACFNNLVREDSTLV